MKRINFNIKDSKFLYGILCIALISVFTLTVAYAALNTVLTISGNAEVVASNWDIYLDNPKVNSKSVNNNLPTISGNTLSFSANLTTPGDYYEFTVDVVNDGTIDAMIESVIKTPELTTEQAKYLKYEICYQNGQSVSTNQTLFSGTKMPIKVRIEFRNDIDASDLPTTETLLNLSLTLVYTQGEGSGNSVNNNGAISIFVDGYIDDIGTIVTLGTEQFYVFGADDNNIKLLAKMNISFDNPPIQSFDYGSMSVYDFDENAVNEYFDNYKNYLEISSGVKVSNVRQITADELEDPDTFACDISSEWGGTCKDTLYSWVYSTEYYISGNELIVYTSGNLGNNIFENHGFRPVIEVPREYFLSFKKN